MDVHEAPVTGRGDGADLPLGQDPVPVEAHARWLADWLRAWPGEAAAERARHFRRLAEEIGLKVEGMPGADGRRTLTHIAERYRHMAERYERRMSGGALDL